MATPGTPSGENHSADSQIVRRERREALRVELLLDLGNPVLEDAPLDGHPELGDPEVQKPLVRPRRPLVDRDLGGPGCRERQGLWSVSGHPQPVYAETRRQAPLSGVVGTIAKDCRPRARPAVPLCMIRLISLDIDGTHPRQCGPVAACQP